MKRLDTAATRRRRSYRTSWKILAGLFIWILAMVISTSSNLAQHPGNVIVNPTVPQELPVEVETELAPGSLKQAPLWFEVAQLLDNPYAVTCPEDDPATADNESVECETTAEIERRPRFRFGSPNLAMPPLKVWSPCFNPLTGQPLRLRESDGEISWDQPGPLFDPDQEIEYDETGTPVTLRTIIGYLVVNDEDELVVSKTDESDPDGELPEDGTVIAEPACDENGQITDDGEVVTSFEKPISELDFLRPASDIGAGVAPYGFGTGTPASVRPWIGRRGATALGKALFWDMQVGSDGVQACGSCHFHAGVDNRTKNQLNPNSLGGDGGLEVHSGPNQDLKVSDYPFHRLADINGPGDPLSGNVTQDSNDVMSSMGVRFREFLDIPAPGTGAFFMAGSGTTGVRVLRPDIPVTENAADPIALFQGLRRVEPRNTPTIFGVAFNFDNFWDGRARHDSNGGSVFGPVDPQFHVFIDPGGPGALEGASNGHFRDDLDPEIAEQPVRIRFSSLASLATGPALSDFEMSFAGRNWPKLGKKLLQAGVTPLANQLVATNDSTLGPFSNQGGSVCVALNRPRAVGRPGLCLTYPELIMLSFRRDLWHNTTQHLDGALARCIGTAKNGVATPDGCDPFDGYVLSDPVAGRAAAANTNQFTQMEANFSLFFGQSVQAWQMLLIPDDTPFDRFMDANPRAANGVGQPGEQNTLPPDQVSTLVGPLTMVAGFGPDELFGFDIFAGANLTAALPVGNRRNPAGVGSNPFMRTGRCMICHLGPEQTDHTNNVNAGLLLSGTEFELPPPGVAEPTGAFRVVTGISLAEETEENAQDGVEVENRNFAMNDDPATPWDDRQVGVPNGIAFQDNGVYNIGVRPTNEDIMRGGDDAFGWPLSLAAMALKNLAGADFEPCDTPQDVADGTCTEAMANFNPDLGPGGGLFEETGADQSINPGLEMEPAEPQLPEYLAPWANNLPAGELHPEIDELAFAPNTVTPDPPFAEYGEILFGSDLHCVWDEATQSWGELCPNTQSAIPNNFDPPTNGTLPFANRVARNGAVKAPQLRNVELTGPYFHSGSYLTLRQVVDFYMRGGDFPLTNAEDRDPNLVNINEQAFGFGTTIGLPDQFQDGVPDVISQYGRMPDTQSATPEYATPEDAKQALVKFLLSMTDARVKFERAPFDHPEIFIPLDGAAPDNVALGRPGFLANLANGSFKQIPVVGAGGNTNPLPNFLNISSAPADCTTQGSHFCR